MILVLFDIDGTLLATGGAGRVSLNRAFEEEFAAANAYEGIRPDGKTDDAIFREMHVKAFCKPMDERRLSALRNRYIEYFLCDLPQGERFRVLPGAAELLERLSKRVDCRLAVATGNYETTARAKLKRAGLEAYLQIGGYGSDSHDRTSLVRMAIERAEKQDATTYRRAETFMVGDSIPDIRSAKALGIGAIAVATGSTPPVALRKEKPTALLSSLADQKRFLDVVGLD